ncbi:tetratricopeptide repeat protein [Hyphobacterium marinum]|uniref:Tetratricopeptide repeat protein n=1 Tax=Hyphobacterium marinum TaxID=3116574 RepID=A0ABU7LZM6_9PROT|nr:tetratricopeptide repeat protein [Hyphobacterium sp. Y6023]MEE2566896.1 tetratricopeptide repeat protein [Hyphobacterium sp. Y6023]
MPHHSTPPSAVSYRFGPYRLRSRPLGLYRNGAKVALPVQPLRLLNLLLSRGGDLVTQDQIRETVWPDRTVDFTGSTHVAIRQIRAALGDDAANPVFIETVPRQGYRFVSPVKTESAGRSKAVLTALVIAVTAAGLAVFTYWQTNGADRLEAPPPVSEDVRLGEYLLGRSGPDAARRSLAYFEAALADSPDDARALAGAAKAALAQSDYELAQSFVQRAQAAAPDEAATHDVVGALYMLRDWDWPAARQSFERALDLDPERASVHHGLAALDALAGDFDRALTHMEEARRIDPASTLIEADYGWFLYYAGRYDAAADVCERTSRLEPGSPAFPLCILRARVMQGRYQEALPAVRTLLDQTGTSEADMSAILDLPPQQAVDAFNQWRLSRYLTADRNGTVDDLALAYTYALVGDREGTLARLEQAIAAGSGAAPFALIDPAFAPLHTDDRFQRLVDAVLPAR